MLNELKDKKLKQSRYNIEVKKLDNGDSLIFNTLSSSICALGDAGRNLYEDIENIDMNKMQDNEDKKIIKNLVSNGFLVDKEFDEYKFYENIFMRNKFINGYLNITVAVTLDCNMACPYCYETREDVYMNKEIADALIKFTKKYRESRNIKGIHIHWMGGEPLLNLDIIEYISENLIEYCSNNNILYDASMSTNGVLLNKEIAQRLNKYKVINTQITIDGTKEIHNKRRILNIKEGSYDIILNNILDCKDIINIKVRTNIDKENKDNVYELIDELNRYKIEHNYKPVIDADGEIEISDKFFTQEEFSKIDIDLTTYMNKKYNKSINELYPRFKVSPCDGDRETTLKIDPTGLIHNCTAFFSKRDMAIGNIFQGITNRSMHTKWTGLEIPTKCKECKKLPICGGGCPFKSIKNSNNDIECLYNSFDLEERLDIFLNYK
ncbi:MAG: radical SAM protein [Paraclostridium sp.]